MSLDKIDIKRLQSYIEQINSDLKPYENAFFDSRTEASLRNQINEMLDNIKRSTNKDVANNVKLKSNLNGHNLEFVLEFPVWYFEGYSAYELRDMGIKIEEHIPDCAVIKNGVFEYVTLEFTVKNGFTPLPEGGNY